MPYTPVFDGITQHEAIKFFSALDENVTDTARFGNLWQGTFNSDGIEVEQLRRFSREHFVPIARAPVSMPLPAFLEAYKTLGAVIEDTFANFTGDGAKALRTATERISDQIPAIRDMGNRVLVCANGNAFYTAQLMLGNGPIYATDKNFLDHVAGRPLEHIVILSASGSKGIEAVPQHYRGKVPITFFTTTPDSDCEHAIRQFDGNFEPIVTPRVTEMHTYNVSTYLGMILAAFGEDIQPIIDHIREKVDPALEPYIKGSKRSGERLTFADATGFYFVLPDSPEEVDCNIHSFEPIGELYRKKFNELLRDYVSAEVNILNQNDHGEYMPDSPSELYVYMGVKDQGIVPPERSLEVPMPDKLTAANKFAIGYYVISKIIEAHVPIFEFLAPYSVDAYNTRKKRNISPVVLA